MHAFIKASNKYNIIINNSMYTVDDSHKKFQQIVEALNNPLTTDEELENLVVIKKTIQHFCDGKITLTTDDKLLMNGRELHGSLVDRMLKMIEAEESVDYLVKFLENLYSNPSKTAVDEAYLFLETNELPITPDGCFIAYKAVTGAYKDKRTGTFDNSIGTTVSMERNDVDDDRNRTCSAGLHVARFSYAEDFASLGDKLVIVKVNPRDIVSIPSDYNNAKMRCCRYEVVGELPNNKWKEFAEDLENSAVVLGFEYDSETNCWKRI